MKVKWDKGSKRKTMSMASGSMRAGADVERAPRKRSLAGSGSGSWLPFTGARDFVHGLKLKSQKQWHEWSKSGQRPSNVPSRPDKVYKGKGWVSYPDWMGYTAKKVDGQMLPFTSARAIVRSLRLLMDAAMSLHELNKGPRASNSVRQKK